MKKNNQQNKKNSTLRRASADPPSPPSRKDLLNNNSNSGTPPKKMNACPSLYPTSITPRVISQLKHYVTTICSQYHTPEDVPYHNVEHAYHVFLSANKLLDLMLCESPEGENNETIMNGSSSGGGGGGGMDTITNQMKNLSSGGSGKSSSSTMAIAKRYPCNSSIALIVADKLI